MAYIICTIIDFFSRNLRKVVTLFLNVTDKYLLTLLNRYLSNESLQDSRAVSDATDSTTKDNIAVPSAGSIQNGSKEIYFVFTLFYSSLVEITLE